MAVFGHFVIEGAPRTKGDHARIVRAGSRMRLIQSRQSMAWADSAVVQLLGQLRGMKRPLFITPVNMRALVYRDRAVGDLTNYCKNIEDALEKAGVILNDKLIHGHDGTRLLVDRKRPRVEIQLEEMSDVRAQI